MKIYIVQAEHPFQSASPTYAFKSLDTANEEASRLVNLIFEALNDNDAEVGEYPVLHPSNPANWRAALDAAITIRSGFEQDDHWGRFDVWIEQVDLRD